MHDNSKPSTVNKQWMHFRIVWRPNWGMRQKRDCSVPAPLYCKWMIIKDKKNYGAVQRSDNNTPSPLTPHHPLLHLDLHGASRYCQPSFTHISSKTSSCDRDRMHHHSSTTALHDPVNGSLVNSSLLSTRGTPNSKPSLSRGSKTQEHSASTWRQGDPFSSTFKNMSALIKPDICTLAMRTITDSNTYQHPPRHPWRALATPTATVIIGRGAYGSYFGCLPCAPCLITTHDWVR